MYQEIVDTLYKHSEKDFAQWMKPFLSITDNSDEIVLGVRVPILRKLAKQYKNIDIVLLEKLLQNNIHEMRALAIFIMLIKTKKEPEKMCKMYLNNIKWINNWDLVDYSAPYIVAPNVSIDKLKELAQDNYLWANRVAMVSTIHYIRKNDYTLALDFAKKFIHHPHHLMHKAAGWMLREVGKRDLNILLDFLSQYSDKMPAIMRNYAREIIK